MSNGKLDNFNINTIPKLIESDYTETYHLSHQGRIIIIYNRILT